MIHETGTEFENDSFTELKNLSIDNLIADRDLTIGIWENVSPKPKHYEARLANIDQLIDKK